METDVKEMQEAVKAIESVKAASGKSETEILFGGVEQQLAKLMAALNLKGKRKSDSNDGDNDGSSTDTSKEEERKAKIAEDKFKVALKEEMGEGLINIDRQEDKVIITVGSGGAFKSGSADLTSKAKKIMAKIAEVNKKGRSEILVSGHTDDKPLTFGSIYRDNWDLAAARSSSVVQELSSTGKLQPDRMKAISYGETKPLASNKDPEGREKNRRIEIEINYQVKKNDNRKKITNKSKAILLKYPHNPTGGILKKKDLSKLVDIVEKNNLWIISDEVYEELIFSEDFISPLEIESLAKRTVVVSSISKSHAAPGFRSGWVFAQADVINKMLPLAETMLFGNQPFIADMTAYAISNKSKTAIKMKTDYERRAKLICKKLAKTKNIRPIMPKSGMYILIKLE